MDKLSSWLCVKSAPELGQKATLELLQRYPDPCEFVGQASHSLYNDTMLKQSTRQHLSSACLSAEQQLSLKLVQNLGIRYLCYGDADYPTALTLIDDPPLILYYLGDLQAVLNRVCIAVVGTRKASSYGAAMCRKLLTPLCNKGVAIVSGLAVGIDTVAHQTALSCGSTTLAVLASGLETIYPPQNKDLAEKIAHTGALLSEYEPGSKMERWNFPARNRIVSALSQAVMIIEGAIDSGAMLTAGFAAEQKKPIYALPGNINSHNAQGPNHLIRKGAILISSAEDLLQDLGLGGEASDQLELIPELSADEQTVYDLLCQAQQETSFDEFILKTGFSFGRLSVILLNLELKGLVAKSSGNSYLKL